jgi:hypothetical protein
MIPAIPACLQWTSIADMGLDFFAGSSFHLNQLKVTLITSQLH